MLFSPQILVRNRPQPVTSGGAFSNPTSISGLMIWYDFGDTANMYTDIAGTTNVSANNDLVGKINDKSGNANHATCAANVNRPQYKTAGNPKVNFDTTFGQNPGMSFTNIKPAFVCVTCNFNGATNLSTLMGAASGADSNSIRNHSTTTWRAPSNSADAGDFCGTDGTVKINNSTGFTFTNNTPHVLSTTPGTASTEGLETFGLPAALTRYWRGDIYQIVAYSSVPTSGEQASLVTWMGAKAGLTV